MLTRDEEGLSGSIVMRGIIRLSCCIAKAALLIGLVQSSACAADRPITLLVLGDSLSAGYGLPARDGFEVQLATALHSAGRTVQIADGAVSGDTTAGGLARLDWAIGDGADAAIVELGGNDGLRGIDPGNTQKNLASILDRLQAKHIPVLLCGMMAPPNLGAEYGRRFSAVYAQLAKRPGVIYEPFFFEGVALHPALQQADNIHPNADGVAVIVQHILPQVRTLLAEIKTP